MGITRSQIIFHGASSETVNLYIEKGPDYVIPERDYTATHVPGRNGDVIVDTGSFQNVERKYSVSFGEYNKEKYVQLSSAVSAWLHSGSGYSDLQDTYEPLYRRKAYFKANTDFENILSQAGKGELVFICKPQRYLVSGEDPIEIDPEESTQIQNETLFRSLPRFEISGTWEDPADDYINNIIGVTTYDGTYQIAFNPFKILKKIYGDDPQSFDISFVVDTELQDVYTKVNNRYINLNGVVKMANGYFDFTPGVNSVQYTTTGSDVSLSVIPRWWTI